jgi:hypothetical protein
VEPGVDRWEIKTSADKLDGTTKPKMVSLEELLMLPLLPEEYNDTNYPDKLIPKSPAAHLKEGDIITTKGYMHLVALERDSKKHRDGDYHIQITMSPEWTDSCFIVEIPYLEFAKNKELKDLCDKNRLFVRKQVLKNESKEPTAAGNVMKGTVYVKVTGQLFYDAIHAKTMRNKDPEKNSYRGKKGNSDTPMHSYTAWEIHPVTEIVFAPRP